MIISVAVLSLMLTAHKPYMSYKYAHVWGKSIVRILGARGGGTGFQLKYKGAEFILTNDHVCGLKDDEDKVTIDSPWGQISRNKVLYRSSKTDLCIIFPHPQLPALELGGSDFKYLDEILILGHPLLDILTPSKGLAKRQEYMDVMLGIINTKAEEKACHLPKNRITSFFGMFDICTIHVLGQLTTAHIEPGNSGSPVLDRTGHVRGVAFASGSDKLGDIIPFQSIKEFLDDTFKSDNMRKVYLHY